MLGQNSSIFLNTLLYRNNYFDYSIYFLAQILPFVLILIVAIYFLGIKKDLFRFSSICLIVLTSFAVSEILKFMFAHPRPFVAISEFAPLFMFGGTDSFPSGHATIFSALATAVYFENKKLGIFFILCTLFMGIARAVAGVHYLLDILAGFLIGSLLVIISYKFIGKLRNKS